MKENNEKSQKYQVSNTQIGIDMSEKRDFRDSLPKDFLVDNKVTIELAEKVDSYLHIFLGFLVD